MAINPLLALLSGVGGAANGAADGMREDREQAARDAASRASRALQALTMRKDLEDLGLRPMTDSDTGDAARRALASLPGPSVTPSAISVPAPQAAPIPGQSNAPSAPPTPTPTASTPADQAMKQLIANQTFAKNHTTDDAAVPTGPSLTDALHPETVTDVNGQPQQYVHDESITPEASAMRQLIARGKIDRDNTIAVRNAEIATQQNQLSLDRQRRVASYVAAGYTPQQAQVAAENPAMADNIYASSHPRAESPSEVAARKSMDVERTQREADLKAKYIATTADKYIEAANGDPNLAATFALQSKDGQTALGAGMAQADFQAAAQRYKDRFTAKSKSTDDMSEFMNAVKGGDASAGSSTPSAPGRGAVAPAASSGQKQHISQDQADYIKATRGWTDAQIAARYVIR
jgi:hypothetical protein